MHSSYDIADLERVAQLLNVDSKIREILYFVHYIISLNEKNREKLIL